MVGAAAVASAAVALPAIAAPAPESAMVGIFREWEGLARSDAGYDNVEFSRLLRRAYQVEETDAQDEAALAWMTSLATFGGRALGGDGMMPHIRASWMEEHMLVVARRYPALATIARGSAA